MTEPIPLRQPGPKLSKLDEDMLKRTRILFSFLDQRCGGEPTFEEFKHALCQTYLYDPNAHAHPATPEQEAEFKAALEHSDIASLSEELHRQMYEVLLPIFIAQRQCRSSKVEDEP
jgi:hypothetical protein